MHFQLFYTMTDKVRLFRRNMYYGMPCGYTMTDKVRPFRRNMYYGMPCGYTMTDKVRPFRRNMYYGMPCGYIKYYMNFLNFHQDFSKLKS